MEFFHDDNLKHDLLERSNEILLKTMFLIGSKFSFQQLFYIHFGFLLDTYKSLDEGNCWAKQNETFIASLLPYSKICL